jgi:hypothetical protein
MVTVRTRNPVAKPVCKKINVIHDLVFRFAKVNYFGNSRIILTGGNNCQEQKDIQKKRAEKIHIN